MRYEFHIVSFWPADLNIVPGEAGTQVAAEAI